MKKGLAPVAVVIGMVLVVLVIIISWNALIKSAQSGQLSMLNETAFRDYCRKIVFKYHCSICKAQKEMGEEDYDRFLELCRWEVGNQSKEQSIDPEKCLEECGCHEGIMEAFNIFGKYTGIDCENYGFCDASQAGLYALMVRLAQKAEKGDRVLYLGSDGIPRDCFKIIDPEGGFYIRFKDGSSQDCGNIEGCKLHESSPDSVGQNHIKFVMEAASDETCRDENNKIYLNDLHGYNWECREGCSLLEQDDIPISITFTEINKRAELGVGPVQAGWGTSGFEFKVEPCYFNYPIPEVKLDVYASSLSEEIALKGGSINTIVDDSTLIINATYLDYYHSPGSEEGKGTVYIDFNVSEEDKDKFDFSPNELELLPTDKVKDIGDYSENSRYHHIFKCELLPMQTCTIKFPEKLYMGETATVTIKYFAYSTNTTKCIDGVERNYTFPYDNKCKEECYIQPFCEVIGGRRLCNILPEDVVDVENNCKTEEFEFTLYKEIDIGID